MFSYSASESTASTRVAVTVAPVSGHSHSYRLRVSGNRLAWMNDHDGGMAAAEQDDAEACALA